MTATLYFQDRFGFHHQLDQSIPAGTTLTDHAAAIALAAVAGFRGLEVIGDDDYSLWLGGNVDGKQVTLILALPGWPHYRPPNWGTISSMKYAEMDAESRVPW